MDTFARPALLEAGTSDHELRALVAGGRAERIRQGHYAHPEEWRAAFSEEKQVALARAATLSAKAGPVMCRITAAAVHGLPLFRARDVRAHVLSGDGGSGTRSASVVRHRDRWDEEFVEIDGVRATTLVRTVFDVARTSPVTTALSCADAAVRQMAETGGRHDLDHHAAEAFREDYMTLVESHGGARGIRNARFVGEHMDPRPDSPGESVSRLFLIQSGFTAVDIQVPVRGASGRDYRVDFDIGGVFGEFDGAIKYRSAELRGRRAPEQVVIDEKQREDDIRSTTGRRLVRWTNQEIRSRATFAAFLAERDVRPTQRTRFARVDTK